MAESPGDERVRVTTYVPQRQKAEWTEDADRLEMSQAEFLRTMVQAGRRGFDLDGDREAEESSAVNRQSTDPTPGVDGLKRQVLRVLREEDHARWDELVAAVTGDLEDRLESAVEDLRRQGRIAHSPRRGYVIEDGE
jgi:hypothetical protein